MDSTEQMEAFLQYTDEIWKLAYAKCGNSDDADDLTQETYLVALTAIRRGKTITYPRTWLANTLMHIWNTRLREKYRRPVIVSMDTGLTEAIADDTPAVDEAERIHLCRHIASLTALYRQVIVMHYIGGLSVSEIAGQLGVPEGTVKRRLHDGREKMKKEQKTSQDYWDCTPMCVSLSWTGSMPSMDLFTFQEKRLAQQIIAAAYPDPISLTDMAETIGVPVYYIEDMVDDAVRHEILIEENGKYRTDAYLQTPESVAKQEDAALAFAETYADVYTELHAAVEHMVAAYYTDEMSPRVRMKLARFAFVETTQQMTKLYGLAPECPMRKNGGHWLLIGSMFPLGWQWEKRFGLGGHRHTSDTDRHTALHEFDTLFWDSPCRFQRIEWLDSVQTLLDCVRVGDDPIANGVPAEMVERMDAFIEVGLFTEDRRVDIPILQEEQYDALENACVALAKAYFPRLQAGLDTLVNGEDETLPAHLTEPLLQLAKNQKLNSVPMAVCAVLLERGIHLKNVDYICPPAVLVVQ